MFSMQLRGGATRPAPQGSRTLTLQETDIDNSTPSSSDAAVGTLRLNGSSASTSTSERTNTATETGRHVVWSEDTIDNEGAGKKKSKSEY